MSLPAVFLALLALVSPSLQQTGRVRSSIRKQDLTTAVDTLCAANGTEARPYAVGCTLLEECSSKIKRSEDGVLTSASVTAPTAPLPINRNATECLYTVLYSAMCSDPVASTTKPCQRFESLCVTGNGTDFVCDAGPELLPLGEYNLHTSAAWDNLQGLCAYHALHLGRIYNLTTGVSVNDPSARRRSLLGSGHSAPTPSSMPSKMNNTGVPHSEAAHEYCAAVCSFIIAAVIMHTLNTNSASRHPPRWRPWPRTAPQAHWLALPACAP